MRYGLSGTTFVRRNRERKGRIIYHIVRERDLEEMACRSRLFARGLCSVPMIGPLLSDAYPPITLCKRCVEMHGA